MFCLLKTFLSIIAENQPSPNICIFTLDLFGILRYRYLFLLHESGNVSSKQTGTRTWIYMENRIMSWNTFPVTSVVVINLKLGRSTIKWALLPRNSKKMLLKQLRFHCFGPFWARLGPQPKNRGSNRKSVPWIFGPWVGKHYPKRWAS